MKACKFLYQNELHIATSSDRIMPNKPPGNNDRYMFKDGRRDLIWSGKTCDQGLTEPGVVLFPDTDHVNERGLMEEERCELLEFQTRFFEFFLLIKEDEC